MKIIKFFKYFLLLFLLVSLLDSCEKKVSDIPDIPKPPRLVNDFAGLLSPQESRFLEYKLVAINDSSSTQMSIVILKSLNGYEINDMGSRIIQKWGIGQKDKNNGLLILVKPKNGGEKGQVAIVTGYGLEHLVTDALSKQIVENEILPSFNEKQYAAGLDKAVNALYSLSKGEYKPTQPIVKHGKRQTSHFPVALIVILVLIAIAIFGRSNSQSGGGLSTGSGLPFWLLMGGLMGGGGRSEGSWGDFNSGGDDFGGFGGGDSGGGGASGSW